jgi:hypothetical protein
VVGPWLAFSSTRRPNSLNIIMSSRRAALSIAQSAVAKFALMASHRILRRFAFIIFNTTTRSASFGFSMESGMARAYSNASGHGLLTPHSHTGICYDRSSMQIVSVARHHHHHGHYRGRADF